MCNDSMPNNDINLIITNLYANYIDNPIHFNYDAWNSAFIINLYELPQRVIHLFTVFGIPRSLFKRKCCSSYDFVRLTKYNLGNLIKKQNSQKGKVTL